MFFYHGTSSAFAENIIKDGFKFADVSNPFSEFREAFSLYINPEILTNDFFEKYSSFIDLGTVSSFRLRTSQLTEAKAAGPFVCALNIAEIMPYGPAPEYAHSVTNNCAGELELGVIKYLNQIDQNLNRMDISSEELELLRLLKNNAKESFIDDDGKLNFTNPKSEEINFPILFKIKASHEDIAGYGIDMRIKNEVKPEDIVGIAFVPEFDTRSVPVLNFLSKDEFLSELKAKKEKQVKTQSYVLRNPLSQEISYSLDFLENNHVLETNYTDEKPSKSSLYKQEQGKDKELICEKSYRDGKLHECILNNIDNKSYTLTFNQNEELETIQVSQDRLAIERFFVQEGEMVDKFILNHVLASAEVDNSIVNKLLAQIPETRFYSDDVNDTELANLKIELQDFDIASDRIIKIELEALQKEEEPITDFTIIRKREKDNYLKERISAIKKMKGIDSILQDTPEPEKKTQKSLKFDYVAYKKIQDARGV